MARMRTLKPEAFSSETLASLSVHARWTFAGLWTYADDDGRGRAEPRLIKAAVWPLDDDVTAKDIACHLDDMEERRIICRYMAQGKAYLHVVNFGEHQHPNRPVPSKLPPCEKATHGGLTEDSLSLQTGHREGTPEPTSSAGAEGAQRESPETGVSEQEPGVSAGQMALTEDAVSPHGDGSQNPSGIPPSTTTHLNQEGDGDGDVDGEELTAAQPKRKRGTRIPDDFAVTGEMVKWARERVPHVNGALETEKFVNHFGAKSGAEACKLNWVLTWKNWMLNAAERTGKPASPPAGASRSSSRREFMDRR